VDATVVGKFLGNPVSLTARKNLLDDGVKSRFSYTLDGRGPATCAAILAHLPEFSTIPDRRRGVFIECAGEPVPRQGSWARCSVHPVDIVDVSSKGIVHYASHRSICLQSIAIIITGGDSTMACRIGSHSTILCRTIVEDELGHFWVTIISTR
jgi:hypothetical protein